MSYIITISCQDEQGVEIKQRESFENAECTVVIPEESDFMNKLPKRLHVVFGVYSLNDSKRINYFGNAPSLEDHVCLSDVGTTNLAKDATSAALKSKAAAMMMSDELIKAKLKLPTIFLNENMIKEIKSVCRKHKFVRMTLKNKPSQPVTNHSSSITPIQVSMWVDWVNKQDGKTELTTKMEVPLMLPPSNGTLCFQGFVVLAEYLINKDEEILNINDLKGNICLFPCNDARKINKFITEIHDVNINGLILSVPPTSVSIPTVILDHDQILTLKHMSKDADVKVEVDHPNEAKGFETKKEDFETKSATKQVEKGGLLHSMGKAMKKATEATGKAFLSLFSASIAEEQMKSYLNCHCNWLDQDENKSYHHSCNILRQINEHDDKRKELEKLCDMIENHVGNKKWTSDILFIAYCCHVTLLYPDLECLKKLGQSIIECIERIDISSTKTRLVDVNGQFRNQFNSCRALKTCLPIIMKRERSKMSNHLITNIFWIFNVHCGDYRDGYWPQLTSLCGVGGAKYFSEQRERLEIFLSGSSLLTCGLFLQSELKGVCNLTESFFSNLSTYRGDHQFFSVHENTNQILSKIVRMSLRSNFLHSWDFCKSFLSSLKFLKFKKMDTTCRINIYKSILEELTFSKRDTFKYLDYFHSSLEHDLLFYEKIAGFIDTVIFDSLKKDDVNVYNFLQLLSFGLGRRMALPEGVESMRCYVCNTMRQRKYDFKKKLKMIEAVYSKYICGQWAQAPDTIIDFLGESLSKEIKRNMNFNIFETLVEFHFLESINNEHILHRIMDSFKNLEFKDMLKQNMHEIPKVFGTTLSNSLKYSSSIQRRLFYQVMETLKIIAATIDDAITVHMRIYNYSSPRNSLSVNVDKLLIQSFQRGNVTKFESLLKIQSLEKLMRILNQCNGSDEKKQCSGSIIHMIHEFCDEFNCKQVTVSWINTVVNHMGSNKTCWEYMQQHMATKALPKKDDLLYLKEKFHSLQKNINKLLQVNNDIESMDSPSLYDIVEKYQISMKSDVIDSMTQLMNRYCPPTNNGKFSPVKVLEDVTYGTMEQDEQILQNFWTEFKDEVMVSLEQMDFQSMFFNHMVSFNAVDFTSFFNLVREFILRARCTFTEEAKIAYLNEFLKTVERSNQSLHAELNLIQRSSIFTIPKKFCELCDLVKEFIKLINSLPHLTQCAHQYKFPFIQESPYQNLQDILIETRKSINSLTITNCCKRLDQFLEILGYSIEVPQKEKINDASQLISLMTYFKQLGASSEVWKLIEEKKWFGDDGLNAFYGEYRNVTNVRLGLGDNSYEMNVLDTLEPVIRCISAAEIMKSSKDLREVISSLLNNGDIRRELDSQNNFKNFSSVQENILKVGEWFTEGMDDVSAIFKMFDLVWKTGEYHLNVSGNVLNAHNDAFFMQYKLNTNETIKLNMKEINDFVKNLGFIQCENMSLSAKVSDFIELHALITKVFMLQQTMDQLGYHKIRKESYPVQTKDVVVRNELNALIQENVNCKNWLKHIQEKYPRSLLFRMEELQTIYRSLHLLIQDKDETDAAINNIFTIISRLIPLSKTEVAKENLQPSSLISAINVLDKNEGDDFGTSWLELTSSFIENWCNNIASSHLSLKPKSKNTKVLIHTFCCDIPQMRQATLRLLMSIYEDRVPESYEVMDTLMTSSNQNLRIFLQRVLHFPSNTFTILNVQYMSLEQQEEIIHFITNCEILEKGCKLHLIQSGKTSLHESRWVQQKMWNEEMISKLPFASSEQPEVGLSEMGDLIMKKNNFESITVLMSRQSCTGKTTYIREKMKHISDSGGTSASINIHDKVTMQYLVHFMSKHFKKTSLDNAQAVHFLLSFETNSNNKDIIQILNSFFTSLLLFKTVFDSKSGASFYLGPSKCYFFIELFSFTGRNEDSLFQREWVQENIPILAFCGSFTEAPRKFKVDEETRRVCTYLRAYTNGTINRKFQKNSKTIMFCLDMSGSMTACIGTKNGESKSAISVATDNMLKIYDSHVQIQDSIAVIRFNHKVKVLLTKQIVKDEQEKHSLRRTIDRARFGCCGRTAMYGALKAVLGLIAGGKEESEETWIVCLTDGASADSPAIVRDTLKESSNDIHIITIGVNLHLSLHGDMVELCRKYGNTSSTKGFFLPTEADINAIDDAFEKVASHIPVSQTFEMDGKVSDDECCDLIERYIPKFVSPNNKLLLHFWTRFLYKRVQVFDNNKEFNFNQKHDFLGSSLMKIMLDEVAQFLKPQQNIEWVNESHHQLIYDFSNKNSPEFRLICTAPKLLDENIRKRLISFNLPGFFIPSDDELRDQRILERYLSQALGVPLQNNDDGTESLRCIKEHKFVLTLDFTMKILNIHERVSCNIPCIMEGETGVSKTALTKMYSTLINSNVHMKAQIEVEASLKDIEDSLKEDFSFGLPSDSENVVERLRLILQHQHDFINDAGSNVDIFSVLYNLIQEASKNRSPLFCDMPSEFCGEYDGEIKKLQSFLNWFVGCKLEPIFFDINVHSAMTVEDILDDFQEICRVSRKLAATEAQIVVFLDEVNTSSIMGLMKEVIIDRSVCGEALENNVVIVAACNPARNLSTTQGGFFRENDLGKEWSSGHYQVSCLPSSMENIKWIYGSLTSIKEKEFIARRLDMMDVAIPQMFKTSFTELVSTCQDAIRTFASEHIDQGLKRVTNNQEDHKQEAMRRARAAVSLRDIQRVFNLFHFFSHEFFITCVDEPNTVQRYRHSILLTISVCYFLRLPPNYRKELIKKINALPTERRQRERLLNVLSDAMNRVIDSTKLPYGIAITDGLKENIFMTLVCSLSRIPLMIVGPPGCSKTLSVNIVTDNANGEESPMKFYRSYARLQHYHYQCSRNSSSKEIASVFNLAINRQKKVDEKKQLCLVFMDEAGLPEESKESLKVLHYFLEGHMSTNSKVGFVAISNHVLDAAKSNRCVMLLRPEPNEEELLTISRGVLLQYSNTGEERIMSIDLKCHRINSDDFATHLCQSYSALMNANLEVEWFKTFYGLRDFIYFLKCVRQLSLVKGSCMEVDQKIILKALERNFNGIDPSHFIKVAYIFLEPLFGSNHELMKDIYNDVRHIFDVLEEALLPNNLIEAKSFSRYKLIIDETEDDSIIRLLNVNGSLKLTHKNFFKYSGMTENSHLEKLSLVAKVKFAALQGIYAVLSQTECINESLYDLFNQHFRCLTNRKGETSYYANIAVGGMSRPSMVHKSFNCIVHLKKSDLDIIPAPFLNRFEKYCLSIEGALHYRLKDYIGLQEIVNRATKNVMKFCSLIGKKSMRGWVKSQTLQSIYIDILGRKVQAGFETEWLEPLSHASFCSQMEAFVTNFFDVGIDKNEIEDAIKAGINFLPIQDSDILDKLYKNKSTVNSERIKEVMNEVPCEKLCSSSLSKIFASVVEMVITKVAIFRLLQLVTPEAIFSYRKYLPQELIAEYFSKEHFNLKGYLASIADNEKNLKGKHKNLHIVYTRTDSLIKNLPSSSRNMDKEKTDKIKQMIASDPKKVTVIQIGMLKSESSLRSALQSWYCDNIKNICLIIIDMESRNSMEITNYARCAVENIVSDDSKKTCVFLLHYSLGQTKCYPALFLGNWDFFFLDGIGNGSFQMKTWMQYACNGRGIEGKMMQDLSEVLSKSLASAASKYAAILASPDTNEIFQSSLQKLRSVLKHDLGGMNVEDILCKKFQDLISDVELSKTLSNASKSLQDGLSQLSLSSSFCSIIQDTFNAYLYFHLDEMVRHNNLSVLCPKASDEHTDNLFGIILKHLPIPPLEELVLQYNPRHLQLISRSKDDSYTSKFPFFHFVSSFLDDIVNKMEAEHRKEHGMERINHNEEHNIKFNDALEILWSSNNLVDASEADKSYFVDTNLTRHNLINKVVVFIQQNDCDSEDSLFQRYLLQFLHWKFGCFPSKVTVDWMHKKLNALWETNFSAHGHILSIHIVSNNHEGGLFDIAARNLFWKSMALDSENDHSLESAEDIMFRCLHASSREEKLKWNLGFRQHTNELLQNHLRKKLENIQFLGPLRVSCFLHILINACLPPLMLGLIQKSYCDGEAFKIKTAVRQDPQESKMSSFVENVDKIVENRQTFYQIIYQLFLFFFSPSWLRSTIDFNNQDLQFLLSFLVERPLKKPFHKKVVVMLLRNVLMFHKSPKQAQIEYASTLCSVELSVSALDVITPLIELGPANVIPGWLDSEFAGEVTEKDFDKSERDENENCVRLRRYTFSNAITEYMFEIFFSLELEEIEIKQLDSEKLLLELNSIADSMAVNSSKTEHLVLSAKIICFLTKVAQDLALHMRTEAMSGVYKDLGTNTMKSIFACGEKWIDLFINTILRLKGEGKLHCILRDHLTQFECLDEWSNGFEALKGASEKRLLESEKKFRDFVDDENKNAREFKLCPHCQKPFGILAMNCGQFVCGRIVSGRNYGCGNSFSVARALPYQKDEENINKLKKEVSDARCEFNKCNNSIALWNRAKALQIPHLQFKIASDIDHNPLVPTAYLIDHLDARNNERHNFIHYLLFHLREIHHFTFLPDVIEFYLWVHSTFRYLVSKEEAFNTKISDILDEETLMKRFDPLLVKRIRDLWSRVCMGCNEYLKNREYVVLWDCETLKIPFNKLEDATLIMLLSEGHHPTEGNDYLFLIANDISRVYNNFQTGFNEIVNSLAKDSSICDLLVEGKEEINPKSLVYLKSEFSFGFFHKKVSHVFTNALDRYWISEESSFNVDELVKDLISELGYTTNIPTIMNLLSSLREPFRFRVGIVSQNENVKKSPVASISSTGYYFVHSTDLKLFEGTQQKLNDSKHFYGDEALRQTIHVYFFNLEYENLRSMLEGIGNVLDASDELTKKDFQLFKDAIEELVCDSIQPSNTLESFGFPLLSERQHDFILNLDSKGLVELVDYVGYQLASEAYTWCNVPLFMTEPLSIQVKTELREKICNNFADLTKVSKIDEFVRDVLRFYQNQILAEETNIRMGLCQYLEKNNFCDDHDPIFAICHTIQGISVQNYVSLQQELHQIKLILINNTSVKTSCTNKCMDLYEGKLSMRHPVRGNFWLWHNDQIDFKSDHDHTAEQDNNEDFLKKLWFKMAIKSHEERKKNEIYEDITGDEAAAGKIQIWWRNKVSLKAPQSQKHPEENMGRDMKTEEDVNIVPKEKPPSSSVPLGRQLSKKVFYILCIIFILGGLLQTLQQSPFTNKANINVKEMKKKVENYHLQKLSFKK